MSGNFRRGDVIDIIGPEGAIVARGLSEYDGDEAGKITGMKTEAIAAALGYAPRSALVHRDHMVRL